MGLRRIPAGRTLTTCDRAEVGSLLAVGFVTACTLHQLTTETLLVLLEVGQKYCVATFQQGLQLIMLQVVLNVAFVPDEAPVHDGDIFSDFKNSVHIPEKLCLRHSVSNTFDECVILCSHFGHVSELFFLQS